jgi:1-phosphofructokinase
VAGNAGQELTNLVSAAGVPVKTTSIAGSSETRSNITLADRTGVTTKINAPGPVLTPDAVQVLFQAVASAIGQPPDANQNQTNQQRPIVVGAGSLPAGTDPDFYVNLTKFCQTHGAEVALDSSGEAFARAVAAGGLLVIKPNDEELAELTGKPINTVGDVVAAARQIIDNGTEAVLVSLGANGALLVTADHYAWAGGPPLKPLSTVGAGDMTLTGYLTGLSAPPSGMETTASPASGIVATEPDTASGITNDAQTQTSTDKWPAQRRALKTAVAWGRAAVLKPGTAVPQPADLHVCDVTMLENPPLDTPLNQIGETR